MKKVSITMCASILLFSCGKYEGKTLTKNSPFLLSYNNDSNNTQLTNDTSDLEQMAVTSCEVLDRSEITTLKSKSIDSEVIGKTRIFKRNPNQELMDFDVKLKGDGTLTNSYFFTSTGD